jgi:hypothetical protein
MLRKRHTLLLALVSVCAFCAFMAVSASAAETLLAEWLLNGGPVTELTSVTGEGKVLLEDEKVPIAGKVAIVCEGTVDGSVGANGEGEITEVLNLAGETINSSKPLSCEKEIACEEAGKVVPSGLPWHALLILEETGLFKLLIQQSTAGEEVTCKIFGISQTDKCTALGNSGSKVSNGAADVLTTAETVAPNGNCSLGGNGSGKEQIIEGLEATLGGTLSVSE